MRGSGSASGSARESGRSGGRERGRRRTFLEVRGGGDGRVNVERLEEEEEEREVQCEMVVLTEGG